MAELDPNIVTGAFSFTERYIVRRLLAEGKRPRNLINHPDGCDPTTATIPDWQIVQQC